RRRCRHGYLSGLHLCPIYQSSELRAERWSTVLTGDLLIVPAMIWVYVTCFYLWPWRGADAVGQSVDASQPAIRVRANAARSALHGDGCRSNFCFQFAALELDSVVFPRYFQTSAGKDSSHRSSGMLNHPAE